MPDSLPAHACSLTFSYSLVSTRSIDKLQQSIQELEAENSRYTELATSSRSRFEEMASNLFKLSIEIGEEVGERKRRDVDKENENENEIENEGEEEDEEIQEESGKDNQDEKIRERNRR